MTKIAMRGGLSAHAAMLEMAEHSAEAAAVYALNTIAEWTRQKGYPDLAREMLDTFAAEQTEPAPDAATAEASPAPVQPETTQAPPPAAILITGEV